MHEIVLDVYLPLMQMGTCAEMETNLFLNPVISDSSHTPKHQLEERHIRLNIESPAREDID